MAASGGTKAVVAALCANLGIAIAKFVSWLLTGSSSMLAESIHSVADSGNQALLLVGGARAKRQATPEHPFGYGRERYVYAFIVSIVLFSVGGLFALYEAWSKWQHPHGLEGRWWWVPLAVLIFAIIVESLSFRVAIKESKPLKGSRSWTEFIKTSKSPELPVVLLEDFGALAGLVLALAGVSLTLGTGDGRWDAAGTAGIGVLLVVIAIILAVQMKSLLIGESATVEHQELIRAAMHVDGVEGIVHMKTLHLGPDELLVGAKIAVAPGLSAAQVAAAIDSAETRIRATVPIARVIYLEPDIQRGPARSSDAPSSGGATA